MEKSIFKLLVDQYQAPHPFLGVDGQAFPMIPYSMKQEMLQNAGASQGLTMDDLVRDETKRVKQVLDAANAYGDTQLATAVLDELYPLMVEDIESGNHIAVSVYSPVVNQMRYILGATQQSQPRPAVQEAKEEPTQEPERIEEEKPADQVDTPSIQESEPAQTEPKVAPTKARKKKRTPASAIVLFILGGAFLLAFLAIFTLPLIGIGTSEAFVLTGLYDIGIVCVALAVICCVIASIILWRSKKAKAR